MTPRVRLFALAMIAEKAVTKYDLAAAAPCHQRTAQRTLDKLVDEKLAHVASWQRHYKKWIPVVVAGVGANKRKPKPLSAAERARGWRKENPDKVVDQIIEKRKRRADARREKLTSKEPAPQGATKRNQSWLTHGT